MSITKEDLSNMVSKYVLIHDYVSTKHPNSYIFHLNNDYEIAISVGESEKKFHKYEGLEQYRKKGEKGFGAGNCIMGGNTEKETFENIIQNLLDFNARKDSPKKEDLVNRYGKLASKLTIYKNDPIRNNPKYLWDGFGLIHNRILSLSEILSSYYTKWDEFLKNNSQTPEDKIKKEIFGRITTVTTWCLISVFSAIEFYIKKIIKDSNRIEFSILSSKLRNDSDKKNRVYLEDIIKKSVDANIVTKEELPEWMALIELRNIFVHNDGYPDNDKLYYPMKEKFMVFQKNEMTRGPYDIFYTFTEMLVTLYESWSRKYRTEQQNSEYPLGL